MRGAVESDRRREGGKGRFSSTVVLSPRPLPKALLVEWRTVTARFPVSSLNGLGMGAGTMNDQHELSRESVQHGRGEPVASGRIHSVVGQRHRATFSQSLTGRQTTQSFRLLVPGKNGEKPGSRAPIRRRRVETHVVTA